MEIISTGQVYSGARLVSFMQTVGSYLESLDRLHRRGYLTPALQALLRLSVRSKSVFTDRERIGELSDALANAGLTIESIFEDEEHSRYEIYTKIEGDAAKCSPINWDLVSSADYVRLHGLHQQLGGGDQGPYTISKNGSKAEAPDAAALLDRLLEDGGKGLSLQRYKGLGEMNPDQLWDTTMDPERRTLLKVNIEDFVAADTMFSTLMGDQVEPRKEFIIENALEVRELDI